MREDIEFEEYAKNLGFIVKKTGVVGDPFAFTKNDKIVIWKVVINTYISWRKAEVVNGGYKNYKDFKTLKEALEHGKPND